MNPFVLVRSFCLRDCWWKFRGCWSSVGETLPCPRTWGPSDGPGDGVTPRKAQKGSHPQGPRTGRLRSLYVNSSLQSVGDRRQLTGL